MLDCGKWLTTGRRATCMLGLILASVTGCASLFADPTPVVIDTRCQTDHMIGSSEHDTEATQEAITVHDFAWFCACAPEPVAACPQRGGEGSL